MASRILAPSAVGALIFASPAATASLVSPASVSVVANQVHAGVFEPNPVQDAGALALLDELAKLTIAVKSLRE